MWNHNRKNAHLLKRPHDCFLSMNQRAIWASYLFAIGHISSYSAYSFNSCRFFSKNFGRRNNNKKTNESNMKFIQLSSHILSPFFSISLNILCFQFVVDAVKGFLQSKHQHCWNACNNSAPKGIERFWLPNYESSWMRLSIFSSNVARIFHLSVRLFFWPYQLTWHEEHANQVKYLQTNLLYCFKCPFFSMKAKRNCKMIKTYIK